LLIRIDNLVVIDFASHCHIYLARNPLSTEMESLEAQVALVAVVPGKIYWGVGVGGGQALYFWKEKN